MANKKKPDKAEKPARIHAWQRILSGRLLDLNDPSG